MFGSKAREIKKLKQQNADLAKTTEQSLQSLEAERLKNSALVLEVIDSKKALKEATNKLREQTEADIYFDCAKIMKKLKAGEKKEQVAGDFSAIKQRHASLQAMQTVCRPLTAYGSLLGF